MNKSPQAFPWEFIRNVSDTLGVLAAGEAGQVSRNAGKEAKGMPPVRGTLKALPREHLLKS